MRAGGELRRLIPNDIRFNGLQIYCVLLILIVYSTPPDMQRGIHYIL